MATIILKLLDPPANKIEHSLTEKVVFTLLKTILFWVPKASPDYDGREDEVAYWLIEVDEETGRAERKIAFNAIGKPILHAPTDRNLGLWTDSDRVFAEGEYEVRTTHEFNQLWVELEKQNDS